MIYTVVSVARRYCSILLDAVVGRGIVRALLDVDSFDGVSYLDAFDSCCCVSDSDVAAVMLQLCLLLMVAVTGYRVGRYK